MTQNETIPGGKYILGDSYVDAHGKVLGPAKDEETKAEDPAKTPEGEQPKKDKK